MGFPVIGNTYVPDAWPTTVSLKTTHFNFKLSMRISEFSTFSYGKMQLEMRRLLYTLYHDSQIWFVLFEI